MSQNFNRGLENEYLIPYISFTTNPQSGSIVGGGTTTLTAVAAASTGIGYFNYRWYQDDVLSGGITTALSGVTTTRSYTLDYAGDGLSRAVNYKVSAEWVPDNSNLIVSHGTPGVGATGVGIGQSISGYSPSGETFSSVGIVSVAPSITVGIVTVGVQPLGFNTSAYSLERTLSVNSTISNGDNGNLAFQWKNAGTNVSGATSSSYTFTPGYVGFSTYTCLVSYPTDELVSSVTSDSITDEATGLTQTLRLEYIPAGAEKVSSSVDYKVYSEEVDLADYPSGFKIDLNHVQEVINTAGSRNTSTYAWENYFYVSMFARDDDITVDFELGGAEGDEFQTAQGPRGGGTGGWQVIQGTMEKEKEFVGIAATGRKTTRRPATAIYESGSVICIVGNGGRGGSINGGGDGGADSPGGGGGGAAGNGGGYFSSNTLPTEGTAPTATVRGTASRCPKGSSWYQNRYGACETFTSTLRDPDGTEYPVATDSNNTSIERGFKMTNLYLDNGAHDSVDSTHGTGGAGAEGGLRNVQYGGGGGSGYYGGNWEKKAGGVGQNNGNSRSWTYTDDSLVATRGGGLAQTAVTDGQNGYIRIYGRGGSTGNSTLFSDDKAYVVRNVTRDGTTTNGLFLDLREWSSQVEVLIRGTVRNSSSNNFLSIYLETEGDPKYQYDICGDSDQSHGGTGTTVFTINENSGIVETWVAGGALYLFRSGDQESGTSSIFQGGESQCGSGVASGGEFDITVHEQLSTIGTVNNTGTNADLRVSFAIKGER